MRRHCARQATRHHNQVISARYNTKPTLLVQVGTVRQTVHAHSFERTTIMMAMLIWAVISHPSTTVSSLGIPMSRQLTELSRYLHNKSLSKPDRRTTSYEQKSPNSTCFGYIFVVVLIRFSCRDLGTASIATIHM